jgi:hypothetical protein
LLQAKFSDVKLISSEGECFYTNRLILSSSSQLLYNIFLESEVAGEDVTSIFAEFGSETLKTILDFVTKGVISAAEHLDKNVVSDFLAFGIDLSSLELIPGGEDSVFDKTFDFLSHVEIKEERNDYDDNFFVDPETEPLSKRRKNGAKKFSRKSKSKTLKRKAIMGSRKSGRPSKRKRFIDEDDDTDGDGDVGSDDNDVGDDTDDNQSDKDDQVLILICSFLPLFHLW